MEREQAGQLLKHMHQLLLLTSHGKRRNIHHILMGN